MRGVQKLGFINSRSINKKGLLNVFERYGAFSANETSEDIQDFLHIPENKIKNSTINNGVSKVGMKKFLQKLTLNPKEAKMWLQYFKTNPLKTGLPFAVIYVSEDVLFNEKMVEMMAWSFSFLVQNNMMPLVLLEVTEQPRRMTDSNILLGSETNEQKSKKLAEYVGSKIVEFGCEIDMLIHQNNPLQINNSSNNQSSILLNSSKIFLSIQNGRIPILNSFLGDDEKVKRYESFDLLDALITRFKPMKTMILGTNRGLVDSDNKVISDIAIPSDLSKLDRDGTTPNQKYLIKRCATLTYQLPSHSSIILTSADTVIQELFTHHGSGTMIRFLEKIGRHRSAKQVDKSKFKKLLQLSFGKKISEMYWEKNEQFIDTIFTSEKFSAAAIVLQIPGINVPYLDKIAVHPQCQGTGLAASLWNEIVKSYPALFWRSSRVNDTAAQWYNTVSQGSWKIDKWTVYWYGMNSCDEVLPLLNFARNNPESFITPMDGQEWDTVRYREMKENNI